MIPITQAVGAIGALTGTEAVGGRTPYLLGLSGSQQTFWAYVETGSPCWLSTTEVGARWRGTVVPPDEEGKSEKTTNHSCNLLLLLEAGSCCVFRLALNTW